MRKIICLLLTMSFLLQQTGFAQMGAPVIMPALVNTLSSAERFRPAHLRSLSIQPDAAAFDVLIDKGDAKTLTSVQLKEISAQLMAYFRIGLTLPNSMFWVNLRPDSPHDVIDPYLEKTDIGRIMLEADLQLKKDMAAFTSPNTPEGRQYWDKLYAKAEELFGQNDAEIPTLTRPWIVPGEIIIAEAKDGVYIYKATLKVMLEQDYFKQPSIGNPRISQDARLRELNTYSSELIRQLILPKLQRQVNGSRAYAPLRQVYYSLILAQWYKSKSPESVLAKKIDAKDLQGLESKQAWSKDTYFSAYRKSFAEGEYNQQEAVQTGKGITVRQYFSGGLQFDGGALLSVIQIIRSGRDKASEYANIFKDHLASVVFSDNGVSVKPAQEGLDGGNLIEQFEGLLSEKKDLAGAARIADRIAESYRKGALRSERLEEARERVVSGSMDISQPLDLLANYLLLEGTRPFVFEGPYGRKFSFADFWRDIASLSRNPAAPRARRPVAEQDTVHLKGLVYEAAEVRKYIEELQGKARDLKRPLIVMANLFYGGIALAPVTEERNGQTFIVDTDIPVWYTTVLSSESHNNESVFVQDLFTNEQLQFLVKENPLIAIVDGTGSPDRIPDAFRGYRNFFIEFNTAVQKQPEAKDFYTTDEVIRDVIASAKDRISSIEGMARNEAAVKPYRFGFWYQNPSDKIEQIGFRGVKKIAAPLLKAKDVNGPAAVFIQSSIFDASVDPAVKERFIGGSYEQAYFDDREPFKEVYWVYEEGYGLRWNAVYVQQARQLYREYRDFLDRSGAPSEEKGLSTVEDQILPSGALDSSRDGDGGQKRLGDDSREVAVKNRSENEFMLEQTYRGLRQNQQKLGSTQEPLGPNPDLIDGSPSHDASKLGVWLPVTSLIVEEIQSFLEEEGIVATRAMRPISPGIVHFAQDEFSPSNVKGQAIYDKDFIDIYLYAEEDPVLQLEALIHELLHGFSVDLSVRSLEKTYFESFNEGLTQLLTFEILERIEQRLAQGQAFEKEALIRQWGDSLGNRQYDLIESLRGGLVSRQGPLWYQNRTGWFNAPPMYFLYAHLVNGLIAEINSKDPSFQKKLLNGYFKGESDYLDLLREHLRLDQIARLATLRIEPLTVFQVRLHSLNTLFARRTYKTLGLSYPDSLITNDIPPRLNNDGSIPSGARDKKDGGRTAPGANGGAGAHSYAEVRPVPSVKDGGRTEVRSVPSVKDGGTSELAKQWKTIREGLKDKAARQQNLEELRRSILPLRRGAHVARDAEGAGALIDIFYILNGGEEFKNTDHDGPWELMGMIIEVVGRLSNEQRAIDFLGKALLQKKSEYYASQAAQALGSLDSERAIELLVGNADYPSADTRRKEMESLRRLIQRGALKDNPQLKDAVYTTAFAIARSDRRHDVRAAAVELLGDLGDARAKEFLVTVIKEYKQKALDALDKLGATGAELLPGFIQAYQKIKEEGDRTLWFLSLVFRYSLKFDDGQLQSLAESLDVPLDWLRQQRLFTRARQIVESVIPAQLVKEVYSGDEAWYVLQAKKMLEEGVSPEAIQNTIQGYILQDYSPQNMRTAPRALPSSGLEIEIWRNMGYGGTVELDQDSTLLLTGLLGIFVPIDTELRSSPEGIIEYAVGPVTRWERQRDILEEMRRFSLLPEGRFPVHVNLGIRLPKDGITGTRTDKEELLAQRTVQYVVYPLALAYAPAERFENGDQIGNNFKAMLHVHQGIWPDGRFEVLKSEQKDDRFEMRPFMLDTRDARQFYELLEASQYLGMLVKAEALSESDAQGAFENIWRTMAQELDAIYEKHAIRSIVIHKYPNQIERRKLAGLLPRRGQPDTQLQKDVRAVVREAVEAAREVLSQEVGESLQEPQDAGSAKQKIFEDSVTMFADVAGFPGAAAARREQQRFKDWIDGRLRIGWELQQPYGGIFESGQGIRNYVHDFGLADAVESLVWNAYDAIASWYDERLVSGKPGLQRPDDYQGRVSVRIFRSERFGKPALEIQVADNGPQEHTAVTAEKLDADIRGSFLYQGGLGYGHKILSGDPATGAEGLLPALWKKAGVTGGEFLERRSDPSGLGTTFTMWVPLEALREIKADGGKKRIASSDPDTLQADITWNTNIRLREEVRTQIKEALTWKQKLERGSGRSGFLRAKTMLKVQGKKVRVKTIKIKGMGDFSGDEPQPPQDREFEALANWHPYVDKEGLLFPVAHPRPPQGGLEAGGAKNEYEVLWGIIEKTDVSVNIPLGYGEYRGRPFKGKPTGFVVEALVDPADIRFEALLKDATFDEKNSALILGPEIRRRIRAHADGKDDKEALHAYLLRSYFRWGQALRTINDAGVLHLMTHSGNWGLSFDGKLIVSDFDSALSTDGLSQKEAFMFRLYPELAGALRDIHSDMVNTPLGIILHAEGKNPYQAFLEGYFGQEFFKDDAALNDLSDFLMHEERVPPEEYPQQRFMVSQTAAYYLLNPLARALGVEAPYTDKQLLEELKRYQQSVLQFQEEYLKDRKNPRLFFKESSSSKDNVMDRDESADGGHVSAKVLAEYIKARVPGHAVTTIDASRPGFCDQVIQAVKAGQAFSLDWSGIAQKEQITSQGEGVFREIGRTISLLSERLQDEFPGKYLDDVSFALEQALKRAFVRGNAADLRQPLFVSIDLNGQGMRMIQIFDSHKGDPSDEALATLRASGFNVGKVEEFTERFLYEKWGYGHTEILDDRSVRIGTKTTIPNLAADDAREVIYDIAVKEVHKDRETLHQGQLVREAKKIMSHILRTDPDIIVSWLRALHRDNLAVKEIREIDIQHQASGLFKDVFKVSVKTGSSQESFLLALKTDIKRKDPLFEKGERLMLAMLQATGFVPESAGLVYIAIDANGEYGQLGSVEPARDYITVFAEEFIEGKTVSERSGGALWFGTVFEERGVRPKLDLEVSRESMRTLMQVFFKLNPHILSGPDKNLLGVPCAGPSDFHQENIIIREKSGKAVLVDTGARRQYEDIKEYLAAAISLYVDEPQALAVLSEQWLDVNWRTVLSETRDMLELKLKAVADKEDPTVELVGMHLEPKDCRRVIAMIDGAVSDGGIQQVKDVLGMLRLPLSMQQGIREGEKNKRVLNREEKEALYGHLRTVFAQETLSRNLETCGINSYILYVVSGMSPERVAVRDHSDVDLSLVIDTSSQQEFEGAIQSLRQNSALSCIGQEKLGSSEVVLKFQLTDELLSMGVRGSVDVFVSSINRLDAPYGKTDGLTRFLYTFSQPLAAIASNNFSIEDKMRRLYGNLREAGSDVNAGIKKVWFDSLVRDYYHLNVAGIAMANGEAPEPEGSWNALVEQTKALRFGSQDDWDMFSGGLAAYCKERAQPVVPREALVESGERRFVSTVHREIGNFAKVKQRIALSKGAITKQAVKQALAYYQDVVQASGADKNPVGTIIMAINSNPANDFVSLPGDPIYWIFTAPASEVEKEFGMSRDLLAMCLIITMLLTQRDSGNEAPVFSREITLRFEGRDLDAVKAEADGQIDAISEGLPIALKKDGAYKYKFEALRDVSGDYPVIQFIVRELLRNAYDTIVSYYDDNLNLRAPDTYRGIIKIKLLKTTYLGKPAMDIEVINNGPSVNPATTEDKRKNAALYFGKRGKAVSKIKLGITPRLWKAVLQNEDPGSYERTVLEDRSIAPGLLTAVHVYVPLAVLDLNAEVFTQSTNDGGTVGGIDFRLMPRAVSAGAQPQIAQLVKDIPLQTVVIDKEWLSIREAVNKGNLPPVDQLKRYVAACCQAGSLNNRKEELLVCLGAMLRTEEDLSMPTDPFVRDLLIACDSLL